MTRDGTIDLFPKKPKYLIVDLIELDSVVSKSNS